MKKKGISAIVATILIILIVVVGVGIVWKVVLPIFAEIEYLSYSDVKLDIVFQGYTVYDPSKDFAFVQVRRGQDDVNVTGLEIGFSFEGNSKTYQTEAVPETGGKYTYKFNFSADGLKDEVPGKVTVAPIFRRNNKLKLGKILDTEDMPSGTIRLSLGEWENAKEEATQNILVIHPFGGTVPGVAENESVDPEPDCTTNDECDDGLYCNGVESCGDGVCVAGTFVNCGDKICDEVSDSCAQGYFTFRINTSKTGSKVFSFKMSDSDLTVDWGDGNKDEVDGDGVISYPYASHGVYDVKVNGSASIISFYTSSSPTLTDILTKVSDGVTGINSAYRMFRDTDNFGITPLTEPAFFDDVSGDVTNMDLMFYDSQFNQDISNWDTSSVISMVAIFGNSQFNQPISNWDVSSVTNMFRMFLDSQFNQDISNWDTSSVTEMGNMFYASQFNQPISNWDVSSVINMGSMFRNSSFNQPISNWDTSSVTEMGSMFYASQFNQPISNWDTSSVTDMFRMFSDSSFNQPISNWDVSSVNDMRYMFYASQFNQPISNWDVSSVTNMYNMFSNSQFDQDISNWDVSNVGSMVNMFVWSGLSRENYDKILIGWASLPNLKSGVFLDAAPTKYCNGESAKNSLFSNYGWVIIDGGKDCPP
jgi:surface protein